MTIPNDFTQDNIHSFPINFIFATINRQHNIYLKSKLSPYNVAVSEFPVLMMLYNEDKKTQQDIAKTFYLTEGSIARTIRNLEDKDLIRREIDDNNRRRNFVFLTDEGKKIASHIENIDQKWEEDVCDFLNKEEMEKFKQILYRITLKSIEEKE